MLLLLVTLGGRVGENKILSDKIDKLSWFSLIGIYRFYFDNFLAYPT